MIKIENLSVTYPDGYQALKNVSMVMPEGKTTAIIGGNGAGKSTLLNTLLGFMQIKEGEIRIGELPLNKKNIKEIRREIGMVFQNPDHQLFHMLVMEDIAFGPLNMGISKEETQARIQEVLLKLGSPDFTNRYVHKLSGGEKRLAAIAGILVMNPKVLLLDEPGTYLDPKARRNLISLLREIPITKIIVTHDLEMAEELADQVVLLSQGKKVAEGSVEEIIRNHELLESHGL